jgi:hypothetical protein
MFPFVASRGRPDVWLLASPCSVVIVGSPSSQQRKGGNYGTESIRDFAKGVGMSVAIEDNVVEYCKRYYRKIAQP